MAVTGSFLGRIGEHGDAGELSPTSEVLGAREMAAWMCSVRRRETRWRGV